MSEGTPASIWHDNNHAAKDFWVDVPRGAFDGWRSLNKFGKTLNADSATATDVWDGANPTEDDDIWVAPTQARVHAITSNDLGDTAAGAGARKVRIYGLKTWDDKETWEDVTLNGLGAVNTVHSYVIIHRMKCIDFGTSGPNIGDIFATAASDGTITAMIIADEGQTQMAVYGVPSSQALYLRRFYGSVERSSPTGADVDYSLRWAPLPETQETVFLVKHTLNTLKETAPFKHPYEPCKRFQGPGILKIQVVSSDNDTSCDGGFDAVLEDL